MSSSFDATNTQAGFASSASGASASITTLGGVRRFGMRRAFAPTSSFDSPPDTLPFLVGNLGRVKNAEEDKNSDHREEKEERSCDPSGPGPFINTTVLSNKRTVQSIIAQANYRTLIGITEGSSSINTSRVLPKKHTDTLFARIKKLVSMWADEEIMNGNQVFYLNIMSTNAMSVIAENVPLTVDELSALGVLGEGIVKEYGERLIKNIKAFIEQNSLQVYVQEKAIPEYAKQKMMAQEALLQVQAKKLEDIPLLRTENEALKQRLHLLTEENKNLKKEKIALERRSQDMTNDLESVLKKARTIDVMDEDAE